MLVGKCLIYLYYVSPELKYFRFYCNPDKLEIPRFHSLKNMAFKQYSSIGNLVSSLKLKRKSVLCLYHLKDIMGIQIIIIILFSPLFFHIFFLFTTHCLLFFPHSIPPRLSLYLVYMAFTLYVPSSLSHSSSCESPFPLSLFSLSPCQSRNWKGTGRGEFVF